MFPFVNISTQGETCDPRPLLGGAAVDLTGGQLTVSDILPLGIVTGKHY